MGDDRHHSVGGRQVHIVRLCPAVVVIFLITARGRVVQVSVADSAAPCQTVVGHIRVDDRQLMSELTVAISGELLLD